MKQNDHILNVAAMNMTNFEIHSLGTTASTGKAIKNLLGNEAQFGAGHLQDDIEDGCKENQGLGEGNMQRMKKTGESDENCKQTSMKETSLKYSNRTTDVVLGHIQSHGLSESHEKCKTLRKMAPTDKLWDGCLQLNSSVTVSAVAFFKSGEKMPGVKWSESVEVKGKVKLDAFEKYIQDLPRSRNRGLMGTSACRLSPTPSISAVSQTHGNKVVSLRWKEGSSKLGLAGMKKVAKRYKEGDRVGFAQLSPGIDLYVCPRSETIITILAKHGFFKGKTAIEENKDSLIGCVVWRRNQINVNSVEPKSERCTHEVAVSKVSPSHLPPESILDSSGKNCTVLDAKQKDTIEKDKNLSKSPLGLQKFSTSCNPLTTQSTPSILLPAGPKTSYPDPEYRQVSVGQSLKLVSPLVDKSGKEQLDLNFKLQRPVLVVPPDVTKQPSPVLDSEDLPEFDFGTSCGLVSQAVTNRALDSLTVDKNLPEKGFRYIDMQRRLENLSRQGLPTLHQRRLKSSSHQGLPSDDTQKLPPQKKICRHESISMLPLVVDTQSRAMRKPYSTPVAPPSKNLFDDDDDMPEWCPPDANLEKQSILVTSQSSNIPIHSKEPKLIRPVLSAAAQNPFSSSACVAADYLPFSTQAPNFAFHGPVFTVKQAQPRPTDLYMAKGPTSMEINCNQPFRPNSCFVNGQLPINHETWKGWMS